MGSLEQSNPLSTNPRHLLSIVYLFSTYDDRASVQKPINKNGNSFMAEK